MDLIPVIDVKHGLVVRAERGRRADYRPLETPLAAGSDPVAVARGLLSLFPFRTLYIADLDGIEGRGTNSDLVERLIEALPGVALWIDDGSLDTRRRGVVTVVGSESVRSADALAPLRGLPPNGFVLSLDFTGSEFAGPAALIEDTTLWPERIIVMTLARVGSGEGPDLRSHRRDRRQSRREPPRLRGRRRSPTRRSRSGAHGGRRRCPRRDGAACGNDNGRRSRGDRRPLKSCARRC